MSGSQREQFGMNIEEDEEVDRCNRRKGVVCTLPLGVQF